jgi:hypothetical protein
LTAADLARLEELHPVESVLDTAPMTYLFDAASATRIAEGLGGLNKKLKPLLDYRAFDYWVYDDHRNLVQLVEHLRSCVDFLDARDPRHVALLLDLTWLYLITVCRAIGSIRSAHVSDPDRGLREYLFGGVLALREKEQLAGLLESLRTDGVLPAEVRVDHLPSYYPQMRELVTRVMRRPDRVMPALRLLEVLYTVTAVGQRVEPAELGTLYDDLAAKQAADVIQFLVSITGLDTGFRDRARSLLFGEPLPTTARPAGRAI